MLTSDLLRVRTQKKDLHPSFLDPDRERVQERAEGLLEELLVGGRPG